MTRRATGRTDTECIGCGMRSSTEEVLVGPATYCPKDSGSGGHVWKITGITISTPGTWAYSSGAWTEEPTVPAKPAPERYDLGRQKLADRCGELEHQVSGLKVENSDLRRKVERLERRQ
jgi:hypothetical protein